MIDSVEILTKIGANCVNISTPMYDLTHRLVTSEANTMYEVFQRLAKIEKCHLLKIKHHTQRISSFTSTFFLGTLEKDNQH